MTLDKKIALSAQIRSSIEEGLETAAWDWGTKIRENDENNAAKRVVAGNRKAAAQAWAEEMDRVVHAVGYDSNDNVNPLSREIIMNALGLYGETRATSALNDNEGAATGFVAQARAQAVQTVQQQGANYTRSLLESPEGLQEAASAVEAKLGKEGYESPAEVVEKMQKGGRFVDFAGAYLQAGATLDALKPSFRDYFGK